jgi:hypothetical protein
MICTTSEEKTDLVAFSELISKYRKHVGSAKPDIDRILRHAVIYGCVPIVMELGENHGANFHQQDILGRTAIFYNLKDDPKTVEYVIDRTCQQAGTSALTHHDLRWNTAMWYAYVNNAEHTVALLLGQGVEPTVAWGKTDPWGCRSRILFALSLWRLAQSQPTMKITCTSQYKKYKGCRQEHISLKTFQRTLTCTPPYDDWSDQRELTWIHSPVTNVCPWQSTSAVRMTDFRYREIYFM